GRVFPEHVVDGDPRLVLRDRGELVRAGDVTGGPDSLDGGAQVLVDDDAEPVRLDPDGVEAERLDVRRPPGREQHLRYPRLAGALTLAGNDRCDHLGAVAAHALHERAEHELDALSLER